MNVFHRIFWIVLLGVQLVFCVYGDEVVDVSCDEVEEACEEVCDDACDARGEEGRAHLPAEPYGEFCGRPVYIISATGCWDKDLLDVPQTVNIMSYEDLNEATVYKDLSHALEEIPNVNLGSVAFRGPFGKTSANWDEGLTIRGLGLQRVVTIIDGVRQSAQGVGHGASRLSLNDLFMIESVEVIKGPSSVAYGCDALGGVVAIVTREPERRCEQGMNVGMLYQLDTAQNFWKDNAYVDVGNEYYGLIIGGTYGEYEDPRLPGGEKSFGGAMKKYGGWGKFKYYISDDATLMVLANRLNTRDISLGESAFKGGIPVYDRMELGVQLEVNDISDCVDCSLTAFSWGQTHRELERGSERGVFVYDLKTDEKVNTYEFREQFEFDFCPHALLLGTDIAVDTSLCPEVEKNLNTGVIVNRKKVDARQTRVGLYGQDTWELDPCWDLVLGGRLDLYNTEDMITDKKSNDDGLSFSLGVVYKPMVDDSYYLNIANGFRSPDLGERFQESVFQAGQTIFILGNPDLLSERSVAAEIGTKHCGECFSYQFAAFVNQIDNYVTLKGKSASLTRRVYQYMNVGDVLLYGLEGQCVYTPDDCWRFYATGGRTYSSDLDKISLSNWVFNYGVSYGMPVCCGMVKKITPELILRSALPSFDTVNGRDNVFGIQYRYAGYTTVNAQLSFDLCSSDYFEGRWIVGVGNLLNKAYEEPFFEQLQPGRGFFTSVQIEF